MYTTKFRSLLLVMAAASSLNSWALDIKVTRADRDTVVATAYEPTGTCLGVVVASHNSSGSEQSLGVMARNLMAAGWFTVVPRHKESGLVLGKGYQQNAMVEGTGNVLKDYMAFQARDMDIHAALDWAAPRCAGKFKVLLGHGMGAATAFMEAGAKNKAGVQARDAFDAYIAISPQGTGDWFPVGAWQDIKKPVLSITGTKDRSAEGRWTNRVEPFQYMRQACAWQLVVAYGTQSSLVGGDTSGHSTPVAKTIAAFLSELTKGTCQPPELPFGADLTHK